VVLERLYGTGVVASLVGCTRVPMVLVSVRFCFQGSKLPRSMVSVWFGLQGATSFGSPSVVFISCSVSVSGVKVVRLQWLLVSLGVKSAGFIRLLVLCVDLCSSW